MAGVSDLAVLLRSLDPVLHPAPYGIEQGAAAGAFAVVAEDEGPTVIAEVTVLRAAGIVVSAQWARISLSVQSDLAAVGLTAAFARALTDLGISANVIAGFHHDHILVPWERREAALAALQALARDA